MGIKLILAAIFLSVLSSCCVVRSNYVAVNKLTTQPKQVESVEYFLVKPKRSALGLGYVNVDGNGFSKHEDLIREAKKKAAVLGGDFILREDAGTESKTVYNPGYSSYQSNGRAFVSGNPYSVYGSANQNASGYAVGPSTSTYNFPWSVFSVWVYTPANIGLNVDSDNCVKNFHLNSDAEAIGMMIGDKIIGVDAIDINDEKLFQHLMEILPGDKITFTVSRDGQRINFEVTALSNN
jgi:membrane-associated protease RseP (regulator of RpoE activity)